MSDPFANEFDDVLGALAGTELEPADPRHDLVARALSVPEPRGRVDDLEAAIERDADEAWSLALAFLADEEAAWEAVVAGFLTLGRGPCRALSLADTLRAHAEALLEVSRLLAKGGHAPEVCGASLTPAARLLVLLEGGLRQRELRLALEQPPSASEALVAAFPRPGHERGEELCRLLSRELLGTLTSSEGRELEALRQAHPTSATLIRERYAEVAEVPPRVCPRPDELLERVQTQLSRERAQQARVGAVQLRITVSCSFCHGGLGREEAVFCSGCLAPHHEECFMTHGKCSAPGCGQKQFVRPSEPREAPPERAPRPSRRSELLGGLALLVGLGAAALAWSGNRRSADASYADGYAQAEQDHVQQAEGGEGRGLEGDELVFQHDDELTEPEPDPAVLRAAVARLAQVRARRDSQDTELRRLQRYLDEHVISVNFEETPFMECVAFLRDITERNFVISSGARELIEEESVTVTLRLKDITLANAITLINASHDHLDYRLEPGLVVIQVHDEGGMGELLVEVYDVSDILSGETRAQGGFSFDLDHLIKLLEECVGERGAEDGSLEIAGGTLVMRQYPQVHEVTRQLLSYLRQGESGGGELGRPEWIAELEAKLAQEISIDFSAAPVGQVVEWLQDTLSANITLGSAVDSQTPVTLRLREVPASQVLQVLLEQLGLASSYRHETLFIDSAGEASGSYTLRILDTRDLEAWVEPDGLVDLVTYAVGEDNWDDPARIWGHRGQLIVNQTSHVHDLIDEVLAKLRVTRARSREARGD